jgi:hypothetical protein
MAGMVTVTGGGKHVAGLLSHAERTAAQNALARLNAPGSHLSGSNQSATVYSGALVKPAELGASTLIHGQGMDTFVGGAQTVHTNAMANFGNDTVVSGSATTFSGHSSAADPVSGHAGQHFSLSGDTINIAGVTAEGVKAAHPHDATTGAHTITLADKTTITIAGLSPHDITKMQH